MASTTNSRREPNATVAATRKAEIGVQIDDLLSEEREFSFKRLEGQLEHMYTIYDKVCDELQEERCATSQLKYEMMLENINYANEMAELKKLRDLKVDYEILLQNHESREKKVFALQEELGKEREERVQEERLTSRLITRKVDEKWDVEGELFEAREALGVANGRIEETNGEVEDLMMVVRKPGLKEMLAGLRKEVVALEDGEVVVEKEVVKKEDAPEAVNIYKWILMMILLGYITWNFFTTPRAIVAMLVSVYSALSNLLAAPATLQEQMMLQLEQGIVLTFLASVVYSYKASQPTEKEKGDSGGDDQIPNMVENDNDTTWNAILNSRG
ncbi:hypothetical protein M7I_0877 [Glarea lozoyensis 74030]|uniref:Uncharacterized protein n=1 Tax=Glarea lozoyensis (strain ATCC 74030 / MF5533) TaxID=1104152 RepID=H0EEJ9_GLAL7|nr:hypothetical protein M7I_0877 [Glarea lozoyensis 74030]